MKEVIIIMMNYEQVKAMAKAIANNEDAYISCKEDCIDVTLIDCDENWEECEYNNEEAIDAFMEALENNCIKAECDWGWYGYTFDDFMVNIKYVSSEV